jgi:acylphosphatase
MPDDPQRHQLHVIVHGRVQGVSFRFYTVGNARQLDLTGWVRNLHDGTVEVTVEGTRDHLDALLAFLHEGPPGAHVTKVDVEWHPATGKFKDFTIT